MWKGGGGGGFLKLRGKRTKEKGERINEIRAKLRRGVSKKEIRYELEDTNLESEVIDSVLNKVDEENKNVQFWTKNEKGTIKIVHFYFKQFEYT